MLGQRMDKIATPEFIAPDPHVLGVDVRAADIDDFGHVNNVVYLGWIARAAWAHSKALGFDFAAYRDLDCGFVVTRHEIDYRAACPPDTTALIATWITANDGRVRLRRRFQIILQGTGTTLAFAMSDFATIKISTGRACRMPAQFATGYPANDALEPLFTRLR
ncbi:MAG: acyl-CoA thioesterase [Rhizobiales bacterium TMED83]|jgi:acyl-CoA thioester hydrolase|nr:thioesterase [Rhodobiaceae bacterium]RPF94113.1 MAG: acyl-CoA thioesterase [Rhizobiales bacterium TMED83]HCD16867.1 acyl-CoA thioesterase [Rhodobiaceae bacterium]